jgi:hypothetical protein
VLYSIVNIIFFNFVAKLNFRCADGIKLFDGHKRYYERKLYTQFYIEHNPFTGAHGSVVGSGTMLQAGRLWDRAPMRWIFFNLPNLSSRTMAMGSIQPLTEMSARNLPGG